ncbi:hypothetical protein [Streptomyces sp. CRN 30]|uniref:hypothetical protein n=1 Tax=Streptomyces sp. CRN 30 TaxID=3075613 RepID=UPI002A81A9B2|nr:hypothetical protein [Streptomyces sp. CRN 30]
MSGVYESNTDNLRRSIEHMKTLPVMARKLGEDFTRQERYFTPWPGWTDDYAEKARPQYEENNAYCLDISATLYEALDNLVGATLAALENIESTRTDSTERIREHSRRTEEATGDGNGDTGGGRH